MNTKTHSDIKFIYWFSYYNLDAPSVRYRGKYPLEYLKKQFGVGSFFIIPGYNPVKILRFLRAYFSALFFRKKKSLIVIQRVSSGFIYSGLLKLLIRLRPSDTYYDLDDADYLERPAETIFYFVKHCSGVFVGSRELAKNLYALNENIILNTSPVPGLNMYKNRKNELMTIGWIGDFAGGHMESMCRDFFPALVNLPFKIKLVLLGVGRKSKGDIDLLEDYFKSFTGIGLEIPHDIDWQNEEDIQERISGFDIGIATLQNNELHRSKSAFKLKQYLNNGVPVLSSPLPENFYFVRNGVNGFLCSTPLEYRQRIMEFHSMSNSEYMKLSAQALQTVPEFSMVLFCNTLLTREGQFVHDFVKYRNTPETSGPGNPKAEEVIDSEA